MTENPRDRTQRASGSSVNDKRSTEVDMPDRCNCLQSDTSRNLEAVRTPLDAGREAAVLAAELGRAYQREIAFYREQMNLTPEEADLRALGLDQMAGAANPSLERIRDSPPEYLHWSDLARLGEHSPEELVAVWEDMKAVARHELDSGHLVAKSLEWDGTPWDRARFLAIRENLREPGSQPRGTESVLIDMAAEAVTTWLELSEQLHMLLSTDGQLKRSDLDRGGRWSPSRQVIREEIERTEKRVEQAHKRVLRSIKMLADTRRTASTLFVGHAGQVNVGQQQVNVASPAAATPSDDGDLSK